MKVLPAGLRIIALILIMAKGSAKVLPTGLLKKTVVEHFLTAAQSGRNVRHQWMTVKAWASLINKDCPIRGHTVEADDIHESIRRDPRFRGQEMDQAFNGVGIYRHRVTASETGKKIWCYQYRGLNSVGDAFEKKDDPVKKGKQWSDRLYNPFRMEHGAWPEDDLYESSNDENESDANPNDGGDDETSANDDDAAAAPVELEDSSMPATPDGFDEDENPQDAEFFDRSALPPDTSVWYLSEDAIKLFSPQAGETTIAAIELRMKICLAVFQGRMPVEDVLQGHNANCDLSVTARDNLKLRCGYIYWALWYRLENKNAVNDGTCKWKEHCCQYAINKLSDAGMGKIKSPDTVARWHAVFRVLNKFPLMKKEQNHLPHFLAANDDIKVQELRAKGIPLAGLKGKRVGDLRAMAESMSIELNKIVRKEKVKGWMGKPKGLLQVLWERGFIDTAVNNGNWKDFYSLNGTKDARNNLIKGTSLRQLMAECMDFIEEESLLQKKAREMSDGDINISVDRTPKCHPELAGEGIEYSWGAAKNHYRRLPMSDKKGKENFRHSVKGSISTEDVLAIDRIRKFSRRAREYIVAYKLLKLRLDKDMENGGEDEWDEHQLISKISSKKIEDMKSSFKAHRCAADFDAGFINFVCKEKEQPVSE